jgi:hypothetical protein
MAQIDPSIAMGFRPIQIESPVNQMMAAAQLQGAQQQQQMNALKMQEYQQQQREKNELAQAISSEGFDLNNPAQVQNLLRKAPTLGMPYVKEARMAAAEKAKADKEAVQAEREKFQMRREQLDFTEKALQNSTNPMLARAQIQQAIDLKYVTPEVGVQMLTSVPEDPTEFDAWRTNLIAQSMSAKEKLERTQPKPEKFELGGKIVTRDMNPNSPTYLKDISTDEKTAAPAALTESNVAKLERERAELYAKNPDDPRIKNYDAAIEKETGGTPPEIVREYEYAVKNKQFKGTLLQFKEAFARAGRPLSIAQAAPTVTMVVDPNNPTQMLLIDAKLYKGGSLNSPGVIGIAGKEPVGAKKAEAKETAQENAGNTIALLRQNFDQLDKLGGITSTQNRPGTNIGAYLSTTGAGQLTGRMFGTEAQSERNKIAQTRPLLMTQIMSALGLSAKQLDSNAELKLWLSAATDPTLDLESNKAALDNLENLLAGKGKAKPAAPSAKPAPKSDVRSKADAILGQ